MESMLINWPVIFFELKLYIEYIFSFKELSENSLQIIPLDKVSINGTELFPKKQS